jgi:SAM-dependent methyltransferase
MRPLAFHEVMGVLGVGDLHPGGAAATDFLLEEIAKAHPRVVLEVGAGIGRTTQRMVARGWHVVALEPNDVLRRELRAKLAGDVAPNALETFHAAAESFDAVIGESTLYGMNLPAALRKVRHLLRPGGVLASVDMVWTDLADPEMAARVHDETQRLFGIPMASRERLTWPDWRTLLNEAGFVPVVERKLPADAGRAPPGERIALASALRHPVAYAHLLRYRFRSRRPMVPAGWLETWMAVWRRG